MTGTDVDKIISLDVKTNKITLDDGVVSIHTVRLIGNIYFPNGQDAKSGL